MCQACDSSIAGGQTGRQLERERGEPLQHEPALGVGAVGRRRGKKRGRATLLPSVIVWGRWQLCCKWVGGGCNSMGLQKEEEEKLPQSPYQQGTGIWGGGRNWENGELKLPLCSEKNRIYLCKFCKSLLFLILCCIVVIITKWLGSQMWLFDMTFLILQSTIPQSTIYSSCLSRKGARLLPNEVCC